MELFPDPRIGRARLLRRAGRTYAEIRAVVGPVHDDVLARWLRGIPRPPQTRRCGAKPELRRTCRLLRAEGLSYDEIAARTGASRGSLSVWLRDIPRPPRTQWSSAHMAVMRAASRRARRGRSETVRQQTKLSAVHAVGQLTPRELFLTGVALYWAEGSKSKPWRVSERVIFTNSDAEVITVFLAWLTLLGVPADRLRLAVSIHERADVAAAQAFWCGVTGLPDAAFRRPMLKRHNPRPGRKNLGVGYHGCLVASVLDGATLYRSIEGWWHGIARSAVASPSQDAGAIPWFGDPGSSNGRTSDFDSDNRGSSPRPGARRSVTALPEPLRRWRRLLRR